MFLRPLAHGSSSRRTSYALSGLPSSGRGGQARSAVYTTRPISTHAGRHRDGHDGASERVAITTATADADATDESVALTGRILVAAR